MSTAFDAVNHKTLLERISQDFGIHGTAFNWLRSFVSDRKQYIAVGAEQSSCVNCTSGVPQGSVLGPFLFAMYILPVGNVIAAHSLHYHQYAGDTQLYMAIRPSDDDTFKPVSKCVEDVSSRWFLKNGLLLNPAKTEAVLFDTKVQREKITTLSGIDVAGAVVPFSDNVKLLGVVALLHIRPLLTLGVAKMVGHSIVSSRLDYANALLHGTSANNIGVSGSTFRQCH